MNIPFHCVTILYIKVIIDIITVNVRTYVQLCYVMYVVSCMLYVVCCILYVSFL